MEIIVKQLIEIKALPPFLLHLQTGEELRAWLLKNDLLTEKVFVAAGVSPVFQPGDITFTFD